ncbi:hypothetical protein ACER0A_003685 [Haloimpatiens sp. FM7315]|uniref:hypothetical protein n=1 Tax=Haloimpatiens sp. FM7315 TaxID=3298609 RepID=UPI0035A31AC3
MAINSKDFIPRPGFINKQGYIPDPIELCCVQIPKIFDQCLIKKCLKPIDRREDLNLELCKQLMETDGITNVTDPSQVKKIGCCRNFDIEITSISKSCVKGEEGYKRVTVNFKVTFKVDLLIDEDDGICRPQTVEYTVNQTITVPKFYCPDPIAQISCGKGCPCALDVEDQDPDMIKLEVVADCLRSELVKIDCLAPENDKVFLCITLGLFIIVKSELLVQLLIPCYGYCPTPPVCPDEVDPCKEFKDREAPVFYPPQKMDNLFPDYIDSAEE